MIEQLSTHTHTHNYFISPSLLSYSERLYAGILFPILYASRLCSTLVPERLSKQFVPNACLVEAGQWLHVAFSFKFKLCIKLSVCGFPLFGPYLISTFLILLPVISFNVPTMNFLRLFSWAVYFHPHRAPP